MGGGGMGPSEPPTEWALSMRKWTICLWVLLVTLLIGKLVVMDFFGALSMLIVVGLGYFVPFGKPPMQQRWIIFWGVLCAFNCVFDLVFACFRCYQYVNGSYGQSGHSGYGHYGSGYGAHHGAPDPNAPTVAPTPMETWSVKVALYAVIIGFLVPLVELLIAWVCYALYKDHPASQDDAGGSMFGASGAYGGQGYGTHGGGSVYQQGRMGGRPGPNAAAQHFQSFQGSGQRLGNR